MRHLARYTAVFILTLLALYLIWVFRSVIALFVASFALAALYRPFIMRLNERNISRGTGLIITYGLVFGVLGIGGLFFVPRLLNESQALVSFAALEYELRWDGREELPPRQEQILSMLPNPDEFYDTLTGTGDRPIPPALVSTVRTSATILGSLPLVIMLSIYWASGQEQFERLWLRLLVPTRRKQARKVWRDIEETLGEYIRSELAQVAIGVVILTAVLYLIDYPYPTLLGLVGAGWMLLPLFGTPIAVILVVLCGIFQAPQATFVAALFTALLHILMQVVVEPKLVTKWKYNPLLALFVMILLVEGIGVAGLLLAPPVAALVQITLRTLILRRNDEVPADSLEVLAKRVGTIQEEIDAGEKTEFANVTRRLAELIAQSRGNIEPKQA